MAIMHFKILYEILVFSILGHFNAVCQTNVQNMNPLLPIY